MSGVAAAGRCLRWGCSHADRDAISRPCHYHADGNIGAYSWADCHAYSDSAPDRDAGSCACVNCHAYADSCSDYGANVYRHATPDGNADSYTYANGNTDSYADRYT